jgi:hypothetical protein
MTCTICGNDIHMLSIFLALDEIKIKLEPMHWREEPSSISLSASRNRLFKEGQSFTKEQGPIPMTRDRFSFRSRWCNLGSATQIKETEAVLSASDCKSNCSARKCFRQTAGLSRRHHSARIPYHVSTGRIYWYLN